MLTGNKGEWSEAYAFLKLLAEGRLYAADSNLQKIPTIYYPLIKILREEPNGKQRNFLYENNIRIIDGNSGSLIGSIPISDFQINADLLLSEINKGQRTFSVPPVESFLNSIDVSTLKAKSTDKRDITMVVHDHITGINPELGFSIKSRLGTPSTLFNSNKDATNFIYKVSPGMTISEMDSINSIDSRRKIRDRINKLYQMDYSLEFKDMAADKFKMNLQLIDSNLPLIMGEVILDYFSSHRSLMLDMVEQLDLSNPCGFNNTYNHDFYKYKIKNLLTDIALGMTSGVIWDGKYDATGGYIVVKEDGDLVCYHVYNRNEFQEYLLKNTTMESPSSTRHKYGTLYQEQGEILLKLNLQIRFKH